MRIVDYIRSKGLIAAHVANKAKITRQTISQYGDKNYGYMPTAKSLERIAQAMTEMGVETKVVDLVAALYENGQAEPQADKP